MSADTTPAPVGGGDRPEISPPAGRRAARHEGRLRTQRRRRVARLVGLVLAAVAVVMLWPATWGGITGLTVVNGHSMEPTFSGGDLVVTVRQSSYDVGDVVSYVVPAGQPGAGGRVIHRIHAIDDAGPQPVFTSRGDNNPQPDPWRFGPGDVTGRAVFRIPGLQDVFGGSILPLALGGLAALAFVAWAWPSRVRPEPEAVDGEPAPPRGEGR